MRAAQFTEPAVFRGLCKNWPARQWTQQQLMRALPSVRVSRSRSGEFPRDRDTGNQCPTETLPTAAFFEELKRRPHCYVHGEMLPESLLADCPTPALLADEKVARRSLWISGSGACSPLHYDLPMVLLCQLHGRKRVWLYSPALHDRMRPRGGSYPALTAQERIARTARSSLRDVEGQFVLLEPGDALLMPSGFFHEVESEGDDGEGGLCISVGMNWPEIGNAISAFARWREHVKAYPVLTQGEVLTLYYGEAKAKAACPEPGFSLPVFA